MSTSIGRQRKWRILFPETPLEKILSHLNQERIRLGLLDYPVTAIITFDRRNRRIDTYGQILPHGGQLWRSLNLNCSDARGGRVTCQIRSYGKRGDKIPEWSRGLFVLASQLVNMPKGWKDHYVSLVGIEQSANFEATPYSL